MSSLGHVQTQIDIRKLLVDEKQPILFIGESPSRSLPIALAALRGGIDGIFVSREDDDCRAKNKISALRQLINEQKGRVRGLTQGVFAILINTLCFCQLFSVELYLNGLASNNSTDVDNWFLQADARSLQHFVQFNRSAPHGVIWFQCPWFRNSTALLLRDFVESATKIQMPGDFLVLGLISKEATFRKYEFDEFLNTARKTGYTHVKDDTVFIKECIQYGYKHHSNSGRDYHESFKSSHVTHIFVKRYDTLDIHI